MLLIQQKKEEATGLTGKGTPQACNDVYLSLRDFAVKERRGYGPK
jgi:hypothetical protein